MEGKTGFEILCHLGNEQDAVDFGNVALSDQSELMVVPKADTLTRARSRQSVYDPVSLENESDYFLTPRIRETAPDGHNDEQNFEDAMEVGRPDTRKNYLNWMIQ